jgi:hypothetical protein
MAREARDTALLAKEYGTDSESWSAWDEPIKSRSLSIDD